IYLGKTVADVIVLIEIGWGIEPIRGANGAENVAVDHHRGRGVHCSQRVRAEDHRGSSHPGAGGSASARSVNGGVDRAADEKHLPVRQQKYSSFLKAIPVKRHGTGGIGNPLI